MQETAITAGLDSDVEYLILHGLGNKRPNADTYTADADYTLMDTDGTTGGADTTNVTVTGSFRIVEGITNDRITTLCSTPVVPVDCFQGMIAVSSIEYDGAFPTFPNFDDFNRADEDPLASPPWYTVDPVLGNGTALLRVVSNQCARSLVTGSGSGAMRWIDDIPPGDDGEVFVTVADFGGVSGTPGVHCFAAGGANAATLGGYAVYWVPITDSRPDRVDYGESGFLSGGVTSRSLAVWLERADGYKMGLQMRNNGADLQLWVDTGTGWRWVSAYHKTTFVSNGGFFGLHTNSDPTVIFDDFGGGTSIRFIPQIFRRIPADR